MSKKKYIPPCDKCSKLCCKYVNIDYPTPRSKDDFDELRWLVSHEKLSVRRDNGEWYVHIELKCEQLDKDGKCKVYNNRPDICKDHGIEEDIACEYFPAKYPKDYAEDYLELNTLEELDRYIPKHLESIKVLDEIMDKRMGVKND